MRVRAQARTGARNSSFDTTSALLCRRSLLGRNSERDADVRSFLTRRARCSFQSLGDLCERLFTGHAFQQPKVVFRPWSPRRRFLIPYCWLGHVCSWTYVLRFAGLYGFSTFGARVAQPRMCGATIDGTQTVPKSESQCAQTTATNRQPCGAGPRARRYCMPTLSTNLLQVGHFAIVKYSSPTAPAMRATRIIKK